MFKELLTDAWPIIEKTAPIVAAALGGPYAGTATLVFNLLSKTFGGTAQDIPSLVKNIMDDPESHAKLLSVQSSLPDEYSTYIKTLLKLPSEAEIIIKLKWNTSSN